MEPTGYLEIHIEGTLGNLPLTPDTYDIREIRDMLDAAEHILYPDSKKIRPSIHYKIERGSVRHVFATSMQAIIGINAVLGQIADTRQIDFLQAASAHAIEQIQTIAGKKNYTVAVSTSLPQTNRLTITPQTHFYREAALWAETELYLYGKLTNAGGNKEANIHLQTEDMGTLRIQTPMAFLAEQPENMLYKTYGVRTRGKQHILTGEIDKASLEFIELLEYAPRHDPGYLDALIAKGTRAWAQIPDTDAWLREVKGGYHE